MLFSQNIVHDKNSNMFLDEASSINFHAKRAGTFFKEISSELYEQERDNELKDLQDRTHYLCNKLENIQKDSTKKNYSCYLFYSVMAKITFNAW